MGRQTTKNTSLSNSPEITGSAGNIKDIEVKMDKAFPLLRLNRLSRNDRTNGGCSTTYGPTFRSPEYDTHPVRSHLRHFGHQVYSYDVQTPKTLEYKYSPDFLHDVRNQMYAVAEGENYAPATSERYQEFYEENHTLANLLQCYGFNTNLQKLNLDHGAYHKRLLFLHKTSYVAPRCVREPVYGKGISSQRSLPAKQSQPLQCNRNWQPTSNGIISKGSTVPNEDRSLEVSSKSPPLEDVKLLPLNSSDEFLHTTNSSSSEHSSIDKFLSRDHSPRATTAVPQAHDPSMQALSQSIWKKVHANMQTQETFLKKMYLWEILYNRLEEMSWLMRYDVYLMGSTISGFGTDNSDMDMCIMNRDGPLYCDTRTEALTNLSKMKSFIESTPELNFEHIELVLAKVPILRFRHVTENIEIDLSVNNSVGIRNTHLLHCYAQLDNRVRPLVITIKLWAQHHHLNDPKNATMSSYSLVLMAINFLQTGVSPPLLPCLHKMFPEKFATDEFCSNLLERINPHPTQNNDSLGVLLVKFFKHYAEFDYANYAVSVRTGKLLPTTECKWNNPECSTSRNYLNIEEPFNRTNTGKSVHNKDVFERIRAAFDASWKILEKTHDLSILFGEPLYKPFTISPSLSYF